MAARSKVEFSLTYQELLRRRLGLYENVINIDPGQVVRELKVRVDLQESRKITVLQVPELRTSYQNLIQLPGKNIYLWFIVCRKTIHFQLFQLQAYTEGTYK